MYTGIKDSYYDTVAGDWFDYNKAIIPIAGSDVLDVNTYQHEVKDSKGNNAYDAVNVYKYGDRLEVSLTDNSVAGETYKVTYWVNLDEFDKNGKRLTTKKVTLTVKAVGKLTIKGKVKGNIDLTRVDSSTAKFNLNFTGWRTDNYGGYQRPILKWEVYAMNGTTPVTDGTIGMDGLVAMGDSNNSGSGWFMNAVNTDEKPYELSLKVNKSSYGLGWEENQINPAYKYTCKVWLEIPAEITRDSGDTEATKIEFAPMTFKVVQGKTKFGMDIKQADLAKPDPYARQFFTVESTDKDRQNVTRIESLQLQSGTLADALELVEVPSSDGNKYAIQWKDTDASKPGIQIKSGVKSGTVKVNVFLEGNDPARNKPNATLNLKINIK